MLTLVNNNLDVYICLYFVVDVNFDTFLSVLVLAFVNKIQQNTATYNSSWLPEVSLHEVCVVGRFPRGGRDLPKPGQVVGCL